MHPHAQGQGGGTTHDQPGIERADHGPKVHHTGTAQPGDDLHVAEDGAPKGIAMTADILG